MTSRLTVGADDWPRVSVVMPVRDEASTLATALESVLGQSYEGPLEVLVVVGSSDDSTLALATELAADDEQVRVVRNSNGSTPAALNIGIRLARGEIIARVDGHGWLERDYIAAGVDALNRTGADGVGGVVSFVGRGPVGRAIALAQGSRFGGGPAPFRGSGREVESDGLSWGMFRREIFDRVGMFDEQLLRNQDDEFCHRIRLGGGRMIVTPAMRFSSLARSSLRGLVRQYAEWGKFRLRTIAKHGPAAPRQLMPPALVALLTIGLTADLASGGRRTVGRRATASYVASVSAAATAASIRARHWRLAPMVAAASIAMHLGYGWGFWREAASRVIVGHRSPARPASLPSRGS
jgi:succinoglycan biosynthesis protein ExoA